MIIGVQKEVTPFLKSNKILGFSKNKIKNKVNTIYKL